jgi:type II secretory pathway pseudopilin PulG
VEIMIVVAIVVVLAGLAMVNFQQARMNARRGACVNNLRLLDAAKEEYALANNKDATVTPVAGDLIPYLKSGAMPVCPANGAYTVGAIGTDPTCSKAASPDLHVL